MTAKLLKIDRNGTKYFEEVLRCSKCQGTGFIPNFQQIDGGKCFDCRGYGTVIHGWKEYTPEYKAKLDERRAKRQSEKDAKALETYKAKLTEWFPDNKVYIVVEPDSYSIKDKLKDLGARFNNIHGWYFTTDVEEIATQAVELKDAYYLHSRYGLPDINDPKRVEVKLVSGSEFIGEVGKKFEGVVTIANIFKTEVKIPGVYYPQTVYFYILEDDNHNVLKWKTSTWICYHNEKNHITAYAKGDKVSIKGTIKEHSEYKGIKQTVLTRCKVSEVK